MASENSVVIDTGLDTKDLEAGIKKAEKELEGLEKSYQKLEEKQKRFTETGGKTEQLTAEYKAASAQVDRLTNSFNNLLNRRERMEALGTSESSKGYRALEEDIKRVEKQLENAEKAKEALEKTKMQDTSSWAKMKYDAEDLTNKITNTKATIENLKAQLEEVNSRNSIENIANGFEKLKESSENLSTQTVKTYVGVLDALKKSLMDMGNLFDRAGVAAQNFAQHPIKNTFSGIAHAAGAAGNVIGKTFVVSVDLARKALPPLVKGVGKCLISLSKFALLGKRAFGKGTTDPLKGGLKNILKYGLGIRSLYALVNKLKSAMKEGVNNLAQFNNGINPTNAALSSLQSALTQLKNSLGAAFAPILSVVAPALTTLINLASQAATAVGMLIAKLTGASTFTKAVAVQQDYAAGLDKTAGAAKKAAKELDKYMSPLDDMNKMQSKNDSSGGGGGAGGGLDPNQMFEEVPIDSAIGDIAQLIKDAWANADFTEIGGMIGEKLNDALNKIPWDKIKGTAARAGKTLGTLLTGFVETDGLGENIGRNLGEAINTGVKAINGFLDNTNWESVGKFIGDGLNGLQDAIDWEDLGHLFAAKFNAVFDTVSSFLATFDFRKLGENIVTAISQFFADIKWSSIGSSISNTFTGLLDFLNGAIQKVDWQKLPQNIVDAIKDFFSGFKWSDIASKVAELLGSALGAVAGFNVGLAEMVANMIKKIKDSWDAKKKEWESMGLNVWEGVKLGISNAVKGVGKWILDNLFKPFIDGFKSAFGIHSPSIKMKEMGVYIIEGLKNGLKVDGIKTIFSNLWTSIKTTASAKLSSIVATAKEKVASMKDKISSVLSSLGVKWNASFNTMKTKMIAAFNSMKTGIKTPINVIISAIEKLVNSVISGINKMTSALNKIKFSVPDGFPGIGGKSFGISIPQISRVSIPRLATGAVIPQNKEFLAVLGDQKHGKNLEAPESLIRQIVREEAGGNKGGTYTFIGTINRKELFREVITEAKLQQTQYGRNPFELA